MLSEPQNICVIGGGIAGLTAAYDLVRAGCRVTVREASDRWGGKIFSSALGDRIVDAGPDNFLARVPDATALCVELGLGDQLTVPVSPRPAYIHVDGELKLLPAGTILGVPTNLDALRGVISPAGIERAAQDLDMPATELSPTTTVDDYCRTRLGDELTDTLIDPLVGGINASSIAALSLADGAPQLYAAAQRHRSLIQGLRLARPEVGATLGSAQGSPVFYGLAGGMAQLVDRLVERLTTAGVDLRLSSPCSELPAGFDRVVVATPAHTAASLLRAGAPTTSRLLDRIRHASVAQLTIEVSAETMPALDASGILVPRCHGMVMTACTWFSTKWDRYAEPDSHLVRITSGRFHDDRATAMDDVELTRTLLAEFAEVYADPGTPTASRIVRWPDAFPQYEPGHADLVQQIRDSLVSERADVHLVGNSYDGIGIPATIRLARQTAAAITAG